MSDICLIDIIYKQINKTYILRKHQFIVVFVVLLTHTYQQTYTQKLQFKYLFDTFKDKSLHLSDVMQNYTYKSTSRPHWTNTQKHKHIHTLKHTYTHKLTPKHTMTQTQTKTYANTSKEWQKTILCKTFIVQIGFGHFFSFLSHSASAGPGYPHEKVWTHEPSSTVFCGGRSFVVTSYFFGEFSWYQNTLFHEGIKKFRILRI